MVYGAINSLIISDWSSSENSFSIVENSFC